MKINLASDIIKKVLERDNFSCQKCGFKDKKGEKLEIHHINPKVFYGLNELANLSTLCSICHKYAPDTEKEFKEYISEKIDSNMLETFRKSGYSISKKTKSGMNNQFKAGKHITKAPRGYKLVNKELRIDNETAEKVKEIFSEYLNSSISLTKLAKKHNLTTTGLKKLLKNTTYLGRVKFAKQESKGQHEPLVDKNLFEQVQNKLKNKEFIDENLSKNK